MLTSWFGCEHSCHMIWACYRSGYDINKEVETISKLNTKLFWNGFIPSFRNYYRRRAEVLVLISPTQEIKILQSYQYSFLQNLRSISPTILNDLMQTKTASLCKMENYQPKELKPNLYRYHHNSSKTKMDDIPNSWIYPSLWQRQKQLFNSLKITSKLKVIFGKDKTHKYWYRENIYSNKAQYTFR